MKQIIPNVYVETQASKLPLGRGCNYSFVVTSEGIVMVDTPMLPTDALQWQSVIANRGEVRYIVNTEYHIDHIAGNAFFAGTVISHQGARDMFTAPMITYGGIEGNVATAMEPQEAILQHYQKFALERLSRVKNYKLRIPTVTFSDRLNLYLGNFAFELIHLPGHTPYQVAVYLPREKVIFTGDNFINKWQPSLSYCYPIEWIKSLKRIEAMDVDFIVPGHGEIGDKMAVREFTAFIQEVVDTVRNAINQGMSKEEAADKISFEEQLPARHPGAGQQRRNIMWVYEMLLKQSIR